MIILDKPYVSSFLQKTLEEMNVNVLKNEFTKELQLSDKISFVEKPSSIMMSAKDNNNLIYCTSENSIDWIMENLNFLDLPEKIKVFKDKVRFRELLKEIYPDFFYKEIKFEELDRVNIVELKMPFILKPSIGFFSMGVYKLNNTEEWNKALDELKQEVKQFNDNFPLEVVNPDKFIIEEYIDGQEFAIDAYYNNEGKPIILNILKHLFSSDTDVSDRIYITSKEIMERYQTVFLDFLSKMGNLISLKNFPVHIEVKVDSKDKVIPIEVNPMRFAGWCTTDMAYYAYGINVYEYFFSQKEPDWDKILKDKKDEIYSIVIADIPKDVDVREIEIDYELLAAYFSNPLEIRRIDYQKHPVFGFIFAETKPNYWSEIDSILKSDLKEFIRPLTTRKTP
ncbi:MAG: ATP-grasp 4 superfamily protein [Gracilibacter sp. BRH_c7a]|nr:MAG: ATP-grasp 4 superfamily protein [Gracilibacter sp. BRH_c7a]